MVRSVLMGLVAGQRAMSPLSALAGAARNGTLPHDNAEARLLARPLLATGGVLIAAAEMAGDKMKTAPDRTVFLGLLARTITGGFAGATLSPAKRQLAGAALGVGAAIASSYAGLAARKWAMKRWGQTATGFVEDAIEVAATLARRSKAGTTQKRSLTPPSPLPLSVVRSCSSKRNTGRSQNGTSVPCNRVAPVAKPLKTRGGTMRTDFTALAIAALGLSLSAPAMAATVTFSGHGAVDSVRGSLPKNAAASVGTPFRFSFTFDTAALAFLDGDEQNAFYDLPVTNFAASVGDYKFLLSAEQGFEPVLAISRGFTFFDQPFSEPTLITTFNFASTRSTGSLIDKPFATNAGAYGALAINAFFRTGVDESGVGPDELRNPISADNLTFSYTTRDPVTRQSGTILGAYSGGFASVGAIPEPATWGLMLVGFGLIGSSLRSRRCDTPLHC